MKVVCKSSLTFAVAVLMAIPVLGAAAPNQAEKVAAKMVDFDEALSATAAQIDATLASMNALSGASGNDLASKYKEFSGNVKKLNSMADKAKSRAQQSAQQREDYLKQWQASQDKIQNAELKAASEARRNELMPKIEAIKTSLGAARDTFGPFTQDLNDLVLYLGNNLTPEGITGAASMMQKCTTDGEKVKSDIAAGQTSVKDLAASISPGGVAKGK
jgi:hypothetical protein